MITLLNCFFKFFGLYFCINYIHFKIINHKEFIKYTILFSLIFPVITFILQLHFSSLTTFVTNMIILNIFLHKITHKSYSYSLLILIISLSISFFIFGLSSGIVALIWSLFNPFNYNILLLIIIDIIEIVLTFLLFKLKRLKNGFPYFKNKNTSDYVDILLIVIGIIVIFAHFMLTLYSQESIQQIYFGLILFSLLLLTMLYKAFILYQKQKLQLKTLKAYEQELAETKEKLSTAIEEKEKLVKSNHEFYHRQEALNKKLNDLIAEQKLLTNTEFGEDVGNLAERINNLSNEYVEKTKMLPKLVKTNIIEIDDMLSYLQSECDKNNIEFILKIECDINHIIENYISKSQLETLLGDLIRNAIIAINHSDNKFRSIMTVFGIKDDDYEICVLDSGIDFEIETLINLGLTRASTHLNEGGTGIGFITTFETINLCNASLIINEDTNNNYSKALEIKFDNKNEYVIISKRAEEIKALNKSNRNIIFKG